MQFKIGIRLANAVTELLAIGEAPPPFMHPPNMD